MTNCEPPHQRWTHSVDGSGSTSAWFDVHQQVLDAIVSAYPMPTTFREAVAEYDYWFERRAEMEDVLGEYGDTGLDRPAAYRMDLVDDRGPVGIQDSHCVMIVIQAVDGQIRFDGRPMGEDGTALPGQAR